MLGYDLVVLYSFTDEYPTHLTLSLTQFPFVDN